MFAKSAVLRFLVAENACDIIRLHWHNALLQSVFDKATRNAGSAFGAQSHTSSALVVKSVHFLRNDIRSLTDTAQEKFGMFEHRRAYFLKSEFRRRLSCYVLDIVPLVCLLWQHIFCAFGNINHIITFVLNYIATQVSFFEISANVRLYILLVYIDLFRNVVVRLV